MARLKVSAGGQVTLDKAVLEHLGVQPGDELEADLLPGSRVAVQAATARRPRYLCRQAANAGC